MKIVHVTAYYPPHLGGIEYCAKHLAEQSAKAGNETLVLTSNVGAGKSRTVTSHNLKEMYLWGFEFAHTTFMPALPAKLLMTKRSSIIHLHLSHVYTEMVVFIIAKMKRQPYIAHYHMDVDVSGRLGFVFKVYKKLLLPFVIRGAAKVITLSSEQEAILIERYKARRKDIFIITNGVDESFFLNQPRIYKKNAKKLLFVGRFALQKNLPRIIEALPLLHNKVELHLVGDGELRNEVERLCRDMHLDNVIIHGSKTGTELIDLYQSSDIFVMPSNREGMPLVLLEAAGAGLPIVASDVQGLREFIGEVGVLVKDPSSSNFAKTLDALIENPKKLSELSGISYAWAKQHTWPSIIKQVHKVYLAAQR